MEHRILKFLISLAVFIHSSDARCSSHDDCPDTLYCIKKMCTKITCKPGWQRYEKGRKCIKWFGTSTTRDQAQAHCQQESGNLLTIPDELTHNFITQNANIFRIGVSNVAWIGLSDKQTEGRFAWTNGQYLDTHDYTNWGTGEPNNLQANVQEDCVNLQRDGTWNDSPCTRKMEYICEIRDQHAACHDGWHFYKEGHKCIKLFDKRVSAEKAKNVCVNQNSRLLEVRNEKTDTYIKWLVTGLDHEYWIGLSDAKTEGTFVWNSGHPLTTPLRWNKNEPNDLPRNGGEDCVVMKTTHRLWNDLNCKKNNKFICETTDPCSIRNGNCNQKCIKTSDDLWTCACPAGFRMDKNGRTCYDIDECAGNSHGCTHTCINTAGSYRCECNPGYKYGADGKTCIDIDECVQKPGYCSQKCVNTQGSWHCACNKGFQLTDRRTCVDTQFKCNRDWVRFEKGRKCMKQFYDSVTWDEARTACQKEKATLLVIPDEITQKFVEGIVKRESWVALSDAGVEDSFKWPKGAVLKPYEYSNWAQGEPNNLKINGEEDCVHIYKDGTWNDEPCSSFKNEYICEIKDPLYPCTDGWYYYKNDQKCIKPFRHYVNATDAKRICKENNARLLEIPNKHKQDHIEYLLRPLRVRQFWIGLTDEGTEANFRWFSGPQLSGYKNWASGEPNNLLVNGLEHCVVLTERRQWNDRSCSSTENFICERPKNIVG